MLGSNCEKEEGVRRLIVWKNKVKCVMKQTGIGDNAVLLFPYKRDATIKIMDEGEEGPDIDVVSSW